MEKKKGRSQRGRFAGAQNDVCRHYARLVLRPSFSMIQPINQNAYARKVSQKSTGAACAHAIRQARGHSIQNKKQAWWQAR